MKLSVLLITYNHEKYIAQALDSILSQEVDFEYEVVIGEDCSTDRTREIVLEYKLRHPDKIRLILHDQNQGANRNLAHVYYECRGEYVALLEGDDYWISERKLQQQVAFMDENPDYMICFHNALTFWEDASQPPRLEVSGSQKDTMGILDLLEGFYMPTGSVVLRRHLIARFPDWFYTLQVGDVPLYLLALLNAEEGKIKCFPGLLYAHRVHQRGVWSSANELLKAMYVCELDRCLSLHVPEKYKKYIAEHMLEWEFAVARYRKLEGQPLAKEELPYANKSLLNYILQLVARRRLSYPNAVRWAVRLYMPALHRLAKSIRYSTR